MKTKIIRNLFFNRKKYNILIILLLLSSTLFLSYNMGSLDQLRGKLLNTIFSTYGEHHYMVFGLNDSEIAKITTDDQVAQTGQILLGDEVTINNNLSKMYIGSINKEAYKVGHLQMLEGELPADEKEIAVEEWVAYSNGLKLGSTVNVVSTNSDSKQSHIVVGILKNYSSVWNSPIDNEGQDYLPSVIVSSGLQNSKNILLVKFKNGEFSDCYDFISSLEQKYNINTNRQAINTNAYLNDMGNVILLNYLQGIILIVVFIGSAFILTTIYLHNNKKYKSHIFILRSIGASKYFYTRLLLAHTITIFFITLPLCFLFNIILFGNFHIWIISSLTVFLSIIGATLIFIAYSKKQGHSRRLKPLKMNVPVFLSLGLLSIKNKKKNMAFSICSIVFTLLIIGFSQIILDNYKYTAIKMPDFEICSTYISTISDYRGFKIRNGNYFSVDDYEMIKSNPNVENVMCRPYINGGSLLLSRNYYDSYWQISESTNEEPSYFGDKLIINNIQFVFLDEANYVKLQQKYQLFSLEEFEQKDTAILWLPKMEGGEMDVSCSLTENSPFSMIRIDNTNVIHEYKFLAKQIIKNQSEFNINGINILNTTPAVIISEKNAEEIGLFQGYDYMEIYLNGHTNSVQYNQIRKIVSSVGGQYPNSFCISNKEVKEKNEIIYNNIESIMLSIAIISSFYGLFSIAFIIYSDTISRKKEIGVLMVLGLSRVNLSKVMCFANSIYVLVSIALGSFLLSYTVLLLNLTEFCTKIISGFLLTALLLLCFSQLFAFVTSRMFINGNINECLNDFESE